MPFSLVRVSNKSIDLSVSYNPANFKFKKDVDEVNDDEKFSLVMLSSQKLQEN